MPDAPKLPLDMARETRMFRAFVRVLQSDATLSRVVRTWQVSDGDADDFKPYADVMLPAVRLIPDLDRLQLNSPSGYYEGVAVAIEYALAGTDADDRLNFWGALLAALYWDTPVDIGDNPDGSDASGDTVARYLRENYSENGYWADPARLAQPPQPGQSMPYQLCRARYVLGTFVPA